MQRVFTSNRRGNDAHLVETALTHTAVARAAPAWRPAAWRTLALADVPVFRCRDNKFPESVA